MHEKFWAMTGNSEFRANGLPNYHPVICHLADTAAVAMAIVEDYLSPLAVATLENGLSLSGNSLIKCCGFFAGSHDLGKVSPAFQFQVSEVGKALLGDEVSNLWLKLPSEIRNGKAPHGTVTAKTLPEFLLETGLGQTLSKRSAGKLARRLAAIVGGHHGFFPSQTEIDALDDLLSGTKEGSQWRQFSHSIFEQLQTFVGLTQEDLPSQCDNASAMLLAGLTTVSDWIASNPDPENGFPYANDTPFEEYAAGLEEKANRALTAIGWKTLPTEQPLTFEDLFPEIENPRPLQTASIQLSEELTPPCLVLVEASMGEGKTEAALYLADYLQHQTKAGGFYIGLPTQATSNAMWKRVQKFLKQRYSESIVNLTLSHSAAALKEEYQQTVCRLDQVYDQEGRVAASEWHTARKRTMLSPYGVGTVDQALMGAVRSKHQFVRLFGLAGRTVILDEIHAYDLYTSTLLERFLEWLAVLGSPVIALSATLPIDTRRRLIAAYAKGCGYADPELPQANYPRITAFTAGETLVKSFEASDHVRRSLNLHWVNDAKWAAELREKLVDGGCAAVICSTVGRAQEVFGQLQQDFAEDELGLFHGRFLFIDRERIEKDCLAKFGRDCPTRPYRYVLVATQVIEQSLDVDFDLMISDMAPIDLLLQRSGRLHRHIRYYRPERLKEATLWLVEPTIDPANTVQFGETRFIYNRHILLRTWLTLRNKTCIQLPEETDPLIESVYQLDIPIPEDLESVHRKDWENSLADYLVGETSKKIAQANAVKLPPAIHENHPSEFTRQGEADDDDAIATVTRLGEPTVTTIFLQLTPSGLTLPSKSSPINLNEPPNLARIREFLEHSTRIGKRGLVAELLKEKQKNPKSWTSALLRHCCYVELNEQGIAQVGKWTLELDKQLGVVIEKEE